MTDSMISDSDWEYLNEYGLHVGLLSQLEDGSGTLLPPPEQMLLKLRQRECRILPLLQCAQRHPLISDEFTLLLVERLRDVWVRDDKQEGARPTCALYLELAGTGGISTVLERHLGDLRALINCLMGYRSLSPGLFVHTTWDKACSRWSSDQRHSLRAVFLAASESQISRLSWPDLAVDGGIGDHRLAKKFQQQFQHQEHANAIG